MKKPENTLITVIATKKVYKG